MISLPLFGKDSSPHRTSLVLSIIITVVLWLIFSLVLIFIRFPEKTQEYKTIQIVLDPLPQTLEDVSSANEVDTNSAEAMWTEEITEEVTEDFIQDTVETVETVETEAISDTVEEIVQETAEPVAVEQIISVSEPAPVIKEPVAEPVKEVVPVPKAPEKPVETPKTEEKVKPAPEPVKEVYNPALTKSVEELMAEQMANKKQNKVVDWDAMFGDEEETPAAETKTINKVNNQSTTSGAAVSTAVTTTQKQSSEVEQKTSTTKSSTETNSALSKIAKTSFTSTSNDGDVKSEVSVNSSTSGDGKVQMEMADGSKRTLITPSVPEIKLVKSAKQITQTLTVRITFEVEKSGLVIRKEIKITPESILPLAVKEEIIEQLSQWVFDSSDYAATATFEYTIVKR